MWGLSDDLYLLTLAVLLDLVIGEPPARIHPTVWIGRTVSWADRLSPREGGRALLAGALAVLVITVLWGGAAYFTAVGLREAHSLAYILVGAALLKTDTELMLKSRRVVPRRLLEAGFTFNTATWAQACPQLVQRFPIAPPPSLSSTIDHRRIAQ